MARISAFNSRVRERLWFAFGVCMLSACTSFSPYNQTGEEVNRDATQYFNNALLLNVVRSKLEEPLTFITITGLDGTESATGTLGIPSIVFGPHTAASPKNYVFGTNSTSRTNSNTFHVSVVDDPGSFEALLAPINPGLIALFIGQGYDRSLMFFLTISRIREVQFEPRSAKVVKVLHEWRNDPDDKEFTKFQDLLAGLLLLGLTAQTDITSVAAGKSFPSSKLCFDGFLATPAFALDRIASFATLKPEAIGTFTPSAPVNAVPQRGAENEPTLSAPEAQPEKPVTPVPLDTCNSGYGWMRTKIGSNAGSSGGGNGNGEPQAMSAPTGPSLGSSQSPALVVGPDGSLWIFDPAANRVTRVPIDRATGKIGEPSDQSLADKPSTPKDEEGPPIIAYPLTTNSDGSGHQYQIFTRSTYGVYEYIGGLLRSGDILNLLKPDQSGYGGIVHVTSSDDKDSAPTDCFASVTYRGPTYCAPQNSDRTKKLFALLHNLQQLMTAPSNAPTTLQVTTVP